MVGKMPEYKVKTITNREFSFVILYLPTDLCSTCIYVYLPYICSYYEIDFLVVLDRGEEDKLCVDQEMIRGKYRKRKENVYVAVRVCQLVHKT